MYWRTFTKVLTSFEMTKCVCQVFVRSARISVYTEPLDTWVLRLASVSVEDEGKYECHLNQAREPIKMSLLLLVYGNPTCQSVPSTTSFISEPQLTVLDGFGRELRSQYYDVGSSLEICCKVFYQIIQNRNSLFLPSWTFCQISGM